jgi:hypothetical protein
MEEVARSGTCGLLRKDKNKNTTELGGEEHTSMISHPLNCHHGIGRLSQSRLWTRMKKNNENTNKTGVSKISRRKRVVQQVRPKEEVKPLTTNLRRISGGEDGFLEGRFYGA